jgi:hypothetical protein
MMSKRRRLFGVVAVLVLGAAMTHSFVFAAEQKERTLVSVEKLTSVQSLTASVAALKLEDPEWLTRQKAAEAAQHTASTNTSPVLGGGRTFTYSVTTRGAVHADFSEFQSQANQSLNDPRGWARMGVSFKQVPTGGDFILVLAEAGQLPSFSPGCSAEYSCRVGQYVIINQDRWLYATPSWNNAGGSLRDYRHMVVNHETGHWLGHDHEGCGGSGQAAPVMQQQSMDLQGCSFNPWPLTNELRTTR